MHYSVRITATLILALAGSIFDPISYADEPERAGFDLFLVDGGLIRGELLETELHLVSDGEKRSVPVAMLNQLTPGLSRRPDFLESVQNLIHDLGSKKFERRESASRQLERAGPAIRCELETFRNDSDLERRSRVQQLIQRFDDQPVPCVWSRNDRIEMAESSLTGRITNSTLTVVTKFGRLKIPLNTVSAVRRAESFARVDLLKAIDLRRGAIRGEWEIEDGILITPVDVPWALLQLDVKPPASYTIFADVERKKGHDAIVFPIVVGEHECNVCIDGWPRRGIHHTGIELIRGEGPLTNETGHAGDLLTLDKPSTIQIDVAPTSVRLIVDDREMFDWKGDPALFSMQPQWERPDTTVLALGCYNASFRVTRWELVEKSSALSLFTSSLVPVKDNQSMIWLSDGSRLVVDSMESKIQIRSESGIHEIPLSLIQKVVLSDSKPSTVRVTMIDGSVLDGDRITTSFKMATGDGPFQLHGRDIIRMTQRRSIKLEEDNNFTR